MRILFDQGTPAPLRQRLPGHSISTAFEKGWATLTNGALLAAAEAEFDALITTDRRMRFQQNMSRLRIGIIVLPTTRWRLIDSHTAEIRAALDTLEAGQVHELRFLGN